MLAASDTDVDIYRIFWPAWRYALNDFIDLLDPTEIAAAARYRFEDDRNRFVVSHGWLRRILGERLKTPPNTVQIRVGPYGKPYAIGDCHFSLSYGGFWAMIVVTAKGPIGVDLEPFRPFPNALSIARQYFTASETDLIARTHERTRAAHFLTVWTRKEAYLKATGLGLTMPLDRFNVGVQVPWIRDETGRKWRLVNLPCLPTHAAALCAPGRWRWRNRSLPPF